MSLSNSQVLLITRAVILATAARDVLSAFEVDLIREAGHRLAALGRRCSITAAEQAVIEDAIAAMQARLVARGRRAA